MSNPILIAENILEKSDFLSATEQAGPFAGQPEPDSANTGDFRLLSKGDSDGNIADFTYDGTATGDGAGDGTSVVCSVLAVFGDDYFIGGTVEITSGACNGETKSITDFAQATGTITNPAFSAQIVTGVTFTLTVAFASRDIRVELITSGDTGAATFKVSHNAGSNYMGRDDPDKDSWDKLPTVAGTASGRTAIGQMADGTVICAFDDDADNLSVALSTNGGIVFGASSQVSAVVTSGAERIILLPSGRVLLVATENYLHYTDDEATTWPQVIMSTIFRDMALLPSGQLVGVWGSGGVIYGKLSPGDPAIWGDTFTIYNGSNTQSNPTVKVAQNGDVAVAFQTDEDSVGDHEIKCVKSTDGCTTWGSAIAVINFANDIQNPKLEMDLNGDLYCVAVESTGDTSIVMTKSIDDSDSWSTGSKRTIATSGGKDFGAPNIALIDGHRLIVTYDNQTDGQVEAVTAGYWEAYSGNACPVPVNAIAQHIICDFRLVWHGGAGDAGDIWQMEAAYVWAMSNIISDTPKNAFRSTQDNITLRIVIDLGTNERFWADGVGFFGCNVRTLSYQMNASDSWGSPSVNEAVSFDVVTGTVDSVDGNMVEDASLLASYPDHFFKANRHFLRMTSGGVSGTTWELKDNADDYLVADTTAALGVASTETFAIFGDRIAKTFTGGKYRFISIYIAAQQTSDDYYQLGIWVGGVAITLTRDWFVGYGLDHEYDIEMLEPAAGGMIPVKGRDRRRVFAIDWPASVTTRQEVIALLDYIEGRNICLVPDGSTMTDCYCVKAVGVAAMRHRAKTQMDLGPIRLVENI